MTRFTTHALLAALVLASCGCGAAFADDATIDELNLGAYWYGPKITKKDLAGKVVLVELWGS